MIYYLVQSYKTEVDEKYHGHLYPCYLTSYNMTVGGEGFGLQSGTHDALKFTNEELINPYMERAIKSYGHNHEFEIVPFDERILGRDKKLYVVS